MSNKFLFLPPYVLQVVQLLVRLVYKMDIGQLERVLQSLMKRCVFVCVCVS